MKKRIAYFSIFLGLTIIGMWLNLLLYGTFVESRIGIGFHILAEFIMAVFCVLSGIMIIQNKPFAIETNMAGMSMATYSSLSAIGYYGQQGQKPMVLVFTIIFLLSSITLIADFKVLTQKEK